MVTLGKKYPPVQGWNDFSIGYKRKPIQGFVTSTPFSMNDLPGLVARWKPSEGEGVGYTLGSGRFASEILDITGNGHKATQGTQSVQGKAYENLVGDKAGIWFDVGDYYDVVADAAINPTTYTVMLAYKPYILDGNLRGIISNVRNGANAGGFNISSRINGDKTAMLISDGAGNTSEYISSNNPNSAGDLIIVQGTYTSLDGKWYVDNVLQTDTGSLDLNFDAPTPVNLRIGNFYIDNTIPTLMFGGVFLEGLLMNQVASAEDLTNAYNNLVASYVTSNTRTDQVSWATLPTEITATHNNLSINTGGSGTGYSTVSNLEIQSGSGNAFVEWIVRSTASAESGSFVSFSDTVETVLANQDFTLQQNQSFLFLWEGASPSSNLATIAEGDLIRFEVDEADIKISVNGAVVHTVVAPTIPFPLKFYINWNTAETGTEFFNIRYGGNRWA